MYRSLLFSVVLPSRLDTFIGLNMNLAPSFFLVVVALHGQTAMGIYANSDAFFDVRPLE